MKIGLKRHFSSQELNRASRLLTDSFMNNAMIGGLYFGHDQKKLFSFMQLCIKYYSELGDIFILKKNGRYAAIALWNPLGTEEINPKAIIACGLLPDMLKVIIKCGPGRIINMCKTQDSLMTLRPGLKYSYLFMLASKEPGCGADLLRFTECFYRRGNILLDSSVSKNGHIFYKRLGFKMIGEAKIHGISNAVFLKRP